jgi:toxin ParE1/3/4
MLSPAATARSPWHQGYRPSAFKPYRVIDRVLGRQVVICLIVDGRRDMQSMLARRLLGA